MAEVFMDVMATCGIVLVVVVTTTIVVGMIGLIIHTIRGGP
jgi:hypothetical protein